MYVKSPALYLLVDLLVFRISLTLTLIFRTQLIDLSDEDMKILDGIHQEAGQHTSLLGFYSEAPGYVFGWTLEQLGWDRDDFGKVITKA